MDFDTMPKDHARKVRKRMNAHEEKADALDPEVSALDDEALDAISGGLPDAGWESGYSSPARKVPDAMRPQLP